MPVHKNVSIEPKSMELADVARTEGNNFHVERSFFDTLLQYNESLCHAVTGSEAIAMVYANRSAIYFEMKLFTKSIKNAQMARENGYPEKNLSILDKRIEKCEEQIKAGNETLGDDNPFSFFKQTHGANKRLPFVANCLELKRSEKFGRFIITNRDLAVGDIVAIEKPHFRIIKSDSRYEGCQQTNKYQRCAMCFKDNLLDLFPCNDCSSTMFCSEACSEGARKSFHKYECPIIDLLMRSGIMQMAMRVFFQALSMFDGSIEELEKFLAENQNPSATVYDFNFSDPSDLSNAKSYLISLYCLSRSENVCESDSPEKILKSHPKLTKMWASHEAFIRKFISRILQVGESNFHSMSGWSIRKYENKAPQMVGIACYPFISLVNHSCAPNVSRIYIDDNMLLLVEKPIRKGEQLFDCYRTTFPTQRKSERQFVLLEDYSFRCDCIACTNNFPVFHQLKSVDRKMYKFARKARAELPNLDVNQAKKRFQEYCEAIQQGHEKCFPSSEIILLQECVLQCVSIIVKPKILFP